MGFIIGAVAAFAIVVALSRLRPEHRQLLGSIAAVIGVFIAIGGSVIAGVCLILAGAGLGYGAPLFEKKGNHRS